MAGNAHDLVGRVVEMAALVDYQDGSVVSRTIIERDTGTVTLFAFGAGQGASSIPRPTMRSSTCSTASESRSAARNAVRQGDAHHARRHPAPCHADEPFKMLLVIHGSERTGMGNGHWERGRHGRQIRRRSEGDPCSSQRGYRVPMRSMKVARWSEVSADLPRRAGGSSRAIGGRRDRPRGG